MIKLSEVRIIARLSQFSHPPLQPTAPSQRNDQLQEWVRRQFAGEQFTLAPASADASFRRYFRVSLNSPARTFIVMDAPPDKEDCRPFVHVAGLFAAAGVHVPNVVAQDLEQGFLLLSDLGSTTYLQALQHTPPDGLYRQAFAALVAIQKASSPGVLPEYDRALLERELRLFPDWYIAKHLKHTLSAAQANVLDQVFEQILANNLAQPRVYVHRDYHSRNLMVSQPNPGILDFQDAVYGPITYDAVSLLKDAYVEWDEERALDWLIRYWESARSAGLSVARDFADFYRDYEWMGAQRHIKVLGIFARLYHRDGKDGYLKDMPLVMRYLRAACGRYRELEPLHRLLDQLEPPGEQRVGYTF
jgi:aminoglycoside/choline kinase family phosphotransferase